MQQLLLAAEEQVQVTKELRDNSSKQLQVQENMKYVIPSLIAHRPQPNTKLAKSSATFVMLVKMLLTFQWLKMHFTIVQRTNTFHRASQVLEWAC